jgi:hypothetical protein
VPIFSYVATPPEVHRPQQLAANGSDNAPSRFIVELAKELELDRSFENTANPAPPFVSRLRSKADPRKCLLDGAEVLMGRHMEVNQQVNIGCAEVLGYRHVLISG